MSKEQYALEFELKQDSNFINKVAKAVYVAARETINSNGLPEKDKALAIKQANNPFAYTDKAIENLSKIPEIRSAGVQASYSLIETEVGKLDKQDLK